MTPAVEDRPRLRETKRTVWPGLLVALGLVALGFGFYVFVIYGQMYGG